ncbi:uncharacterized protein LOC128232436 [Mya arenaria]|nr:uncharacterized protein LOC128232436 [Mya arenaria]
MARPIPSEEQANKFFDEVNTDGNDEVSIQELINKLEQCGYSQDKCISIFTDIDKNCDKKISRHEFVDEVCKKAREDAVADIFAAADRDGSGQISRDEMINYLKETGALDKDIQRIDEQFQKADADGSGFMDRGEFENVMKKGC